MKYSILPLLTGLLFFSSSLKSVAQPQIMNCPQDIVSCNQNVSWTPPSISSSSSYTFNSTHSPGQTFPQGSTQVVYTFADASGTSTCSFNVTVNATACNISLSSSDGPFIDGIASNIYLGYGPQRVVMEATSGGTSYSWAPSAGLSCNDCSSPVFTPTAAGNYTFTATISNTSGCSTQCSMSICVKDVRAPGNKIYVCREKGKSGKEQTQSFNANSVENQLRNGAVLGSCSMISCSGSTARFAQVSFEGSEIQVYPNPFTNELNIQLPLDRFENANITIYDVAGRILEKYNTQNLGTEFRIGKNLIPGLYIVDINNGLRSERLKVSKQ